MGESADSVLPNEDALAAQAAEDIFGSEENARKTAELIASFQASWERHKHEKTPAAWLADEYRRRYPHLWSDEEEIVSTVKEVATAIEQANADKASLHAHMDAGKSKASWLAKKIEKGAVASGAANVGEYAASVDKALETANNQMRDRLDRERCQSIQPRRE